MVNPIYIFILFLAAAFLFALIDKLGRKLSQSLFYLILAVNSYIPLQWLISIFQGNTQGTMLQTAGFIAPLSINLRFGFEEIALVFLVNFTGFLAAIFLADKFYKSKVNGMILLLLMLLGMNGLIMTRDLFNTFVFLEILSISTYSLIAIEKNRRSLSAGFKYMLAGGIASAFILLGIIFLYRFTGTLNLDEMISSSHLLVGKAGFLAIFLFLFAILLELKPFPANGWALDVYEAVNEGLVSLIAVASSAAIFYVLYKFLPLLPPNYLPYLGGVGLFTFFFSNLVGIKQNNPNRLLGYSSIAQMGLLLAIVALLKSFGNLDYLIFPIAGGIFINHFFAKSGLFWLAGIIKKDRIRNWHNLAANPNLLLLFGIFILALTGFPPFPGFWAKWDFLKILTAQSAYYSLAIVLLGSLFEVFYLFRWLGFALRRTEDSAPIYSPLHKEIAPAVYAIALLIFALASAALFRGFRYLELLPIVALIIIYLVDYLPVRFKGWLALIIVGYYGYLLWGFVAGLELYFALVLVGGAFIQIIATMYKGGTRKGFYPFLVMMILALGNLVIARSYLSFFFAWELMTLSSYFLIMRGKTATAAGLKYIVFSMAAAYLILSGFMLAPELISENASLLAQISSGTSPTSSPMSRRSSWQRPWSSVPSRTRSTCVRPVAKPMKRRSSWRGAMRWIISVSTKTRSSPLPSLFMAAPSLPSAWVANPNIPRASARYRVGFCMPPSTTSTACAS
ncbi:MAG: proton-conducting transporter membrane subunit [Candidatus Cloacimonadales bacterium]